MTILLGSYQATKDITVNTGNEIFTLPAGSIVAVKQLDKNNRKALIEYGPSSIDWMHFITLDAFDYLGD